MKKSILALTLSLLLLTGCGGNDLSQSDVSGNISDGTHGTVADTETEPAESVSGGDISGGVSDGNVPAESVSGGKISGDGVPDGNVPAETVSDGTSSADTAVSNVGGVVLADPEYKKLKEMITFDGEFVTLADIGAKVTETVPKEHLSDGSSESDVYFTNIGAQDECVYFQIYDYSDPDNAAPCVVEYNAETAAYTTVWKGQVSYIVYADKDFIIYVADGNSRIYCRGEDKDLAMPDKYVGQRVFRMGKSLFFNYNEQIYDEANDRTISVDYVCRFAPLSDYCSIVYDNGCLYGASEKGMCLGINGSVCYANPIYDPNVMGEYPFGAAAMDMAGVYPTYTVLWNTDALGDKYEVGYYPHYLVRKTLLRTQYNTNLYATAVTEEKAAVTLLQGKDQKYFCAAVIDSVNKKAALLDSELFYEYLDIYSSGSYVHILSYNKGFDITMTTIKTADMGE
ncbi:MAG: hypothetical protein ACI4XA_00385 [Oscillospiraceae bacterium]